jgi:Flp pilus assembly protein TadD
MPPFTSCPKLSKKSFSSIFFAAAISATALGLTITPKAQAQTPALQLPGAATTNTAPNNNAPITRSGVAAKADPSPFQDNPNSVQGAQIQPALATPFIVLKSIPDAKNKNAIPQEIYDLISKKKFEEATQAIDKELKSNPRNVQLRFIRSRIQIEVGNVEGAKKTLLEITQQFPELPEPYNNLAVLFAKTGNLDQAKEYLELALKVQPNFPTALENLGDVYTRLAARTYGKAVQMDKRLTESRRKMKLAENILN